MMYQSIHCLLVFLSSIRLQLFVDLSAIETLIISLNLVQGSELSRHFYLYLILSKSMHVHQMHQNRWVLPFCPILSEYHSTLVFT